MPLLCNVVPVDGSAAGRYLEVRATGKIEKADYETFVPEVERLIAAHGKLRILFDMRDFHGWTVAAAWEDLKFDLKHFNHIERLAVIGETKWQQWMTAFCRPFTTASIRYFPHAQSAEAAKWVVA